MLDEPTAHLDPDTRDEVLADLLAATAGRTVLLITHDPTGLEAMDVVHRMEGGRIVTGVPRPRPSGELSGVLVSGVAAITAPCR